MEFGLKRKPKNNNYVPNDPKAESNTVKSSLLGVTFPLFCIVAASLAPAEMGLSRLSEAGRAS